jgi:phosphate transport system substrate-binding protein
MKTRVGLAVPVMLFAAACGSTSTSGSSSPGGIATEPATSAVTLSETGSNNLFPMMEVWARTYELNHPNVTINTQSALSGVGVARAADGTVNIGASGAYLSDADTAAHPGLMNIAMAISSVRVDYNLPGLTDHLKLNGKVLAAMYQGSVKAWNDPQIAALNPGIDLPATPVIPLHRSDGPSSDTFEFTQYLSKQDPDGWGKAPGFGTRVDFPATPGAVGVSGVAGQAGMLGGCAHSLGCVAYIGTRFNDDAAQQGLGEAQLCNAAGNYELPDAQSVDAAAAGLATQTPANEAISLVNSPAADGYPITNYEYAIVYSKQKDPATAQTMQAFLHWAVNGGSTARFMQKPHIFVRPLPKAVSVLSDAQIAKITN